MERVLAFSRTIRSVGCRAVSLSKSVVSFHSADGDSFDGEHLIDGHELLAIPRGTNLRRQPVSAAEEKLPLDMRRHIDILRKRAEIIAAPAEEAVIRSGDFENAVREKFDSAGGVSLEQIEDDMMARLLGIRPQLESRGAVHQLLESFRVQFIDPELRWKRVLRSRTAERRLLADGREDAGASPSALVVSSMGLAEPVGKEGCLTFKAGYCGIVPNQMACFAHLDLKIDLGGNDFCSQVSRHAPAFGQAAKLTFPASRRPRRHDRSSFPRQSQTIAEYRRKASPRFSSLFRPWPAIAAEWRGEGSLPTAFSARRR